MGISGTEETVSNQTWGSVNGMLLKSVAVCLGLLETMCTSLRLGNTSVSASFACSFKKMVLSSQLVMYRALQEVLPSESVWEVCRCLWEMRQENLSLLCVQKRQVAKSTSLKRNLLEQTEAKSSFGNDKTVTARSLCY